MKTKMEGGSFDTELEASDWRYSAAILGLLKYFKFHDLEGAYKIEGDRLCYNSTAITEEKYLEYIEKAYESEFHHKFVEQHLLGKEFTEDDIKEINKSLSGNVIMIKVFGKIKFDGTNQDEILPLIQNHRSELVKETYRYKDNLYKNYCNDKLLFQEGQKCCRLWGYYFDHPKKGKSLSYGFNPSSYCGQDIQEFDFIPFAFTGDREAFFVNDNTSIQRLFDTNTVLQGRVETDMKERNGSTKDVRSAFFKSLIESANFVNYDVEVLVKNRKNAFFETMFLRKQSIKILKSLNGQHNKYKTFCFFYKLNDNYLNVQKEVTDCILNLVLLDSLIEFFLKENVKDRDNRYLISLMIELNQKIRGGYSMKKVLENAKECGRKVALEIPENKLNSYRQKLTSAIVFKDYDRVCDILIQLSNYSNVAFDFAYGLFEEFEKNKDAAYTFINSLRKLQEKETKKEADA